MSKTRYDWSNVPKKVKWISTDADGYAWYWYDKPEIIGNEWLTGKSYIGDFISIDDNPYKGKWEDSLEERPNEY